MILPRAILLAGWIKETLNSSKYIIELGLDLVFLLDTEKFLMSLLTNGSKELIRLFSSERTCFSRKVHCKVVSSIRVCGK